jgi:hypothetical protein
VPFSVIINKADLSDRWDVDDAAVRQLTARGWTVTRTSAMTGEGVNEAFLTLAQRMVNEMGPDPV